MEITSYSAIVPFGPTELNITFARWDNCTEGGDLDICTLCAAIHCEINPHLNSAWLDESPRFTALRYAMVFVYYVVCCVHVYCARD